jgi:hypothetical protein
MNKREQILEALYTFIQQRPGLEFGNYGDVKPYREEMRRITRQRHDAETLLRAISLSSMDEATLRSGFRAYSGRLTRTDRPDGSVALNYCTGQYWPTEYRAAVCAVAAAALWDYYRDDFAASAKPGESPGDAIRRCFKQHFGTRFANRWFR